MQASWLPKEYRTGSVFRAAARYKGAPFKLQQQLAHGSGGNNDMYLSRRMGVGSSICIMQWEVRPPCHSASAPHSLLCECVCCQAAASFKSG